MPRPPRAAAHAAASDAGGAGAAGGGGSAGAAGAAVLRRVAATLPGGGEDRPGQSVMAGHVARIMADQGHLVVQAGTGTGKSLAYLVPAALSGKKVVVATATKALQDQLADKDLPLVEQALPGRITHAVLKGRSNYLCRQRAAEIDGRDAQLTLDAAVPGEPESTGEERGGGAGEIETEGGAGMGRERGSLVDQVRALLAWATASPTGDRADLPFEPSPRAWSMVSVGARECPGARRCPSGGSCFAEAARAAAAQADVVVVNTHLYGAHLASGGAVLPPHDVVVFDEAHQLEEVMTASLGVELTPGRLRALAALARPALGQPALAGAEGSASVPGRGRAPTPSPAAHDRTADALVETADRLQDALAPRRGARVLTGDHSGDAELTVLLERATRQVGDLTERLRAAARSGELVSAPGRASTRSSSGHDDQPTGDRTRATRALSAAGHLAEDLSRLANRQEDQVAWVEGSDGFAALRLAPIDVGPVLAELLWPEVGAVLTSATIPPGIGAQLGLDAGTPVLDVGSPFPYREHALLYVPAHLPDRRRPEAEAAIVEELAALAAAAGGRTLALFTSIRAMRAASEALRDRLPFPLLVQGDLPKARLVRHFAQDEAACLFATMGYWQGIDVPGPSLSVVVVDRLPFSRPDDPLLSARRERAGAGAFRTVDLPRAATLLAQGAGRLVRTATDRGVVAVLDSRLATAGYRSVLLDALPPMRRTTDRREVEAFLTACTEGRPGQTA